MRVEYKVREVKRYIITRYKSNDSKTTGSSSVRGEYDNFDTAYTVAYALAKHEHELLGYAPGDDRVVYPESEPIPYE